jgi:hypothetical protein
MNPNASSTIAAQNTSSGHASNRGSAKMLGLPLRLPTSVACAASADAAATAAAACAVAALAAAEPPAPR